MHYSVTLPAWQKASGNSFLHTSPRNQACDVGLQASDKQCNCYYTPNKVHIQFWPLASQGLNSQTKFRPGVSKPRNESQGMRKWPCASLIIQQKALKGFLSHTGFGCSPSGYGLFLFSLRTFSHLRLSQDFRLLRGGRN